MKLTKIFEKAKPFTNVFGHKDYNLTMNEDDFHRVKAIVDDYHKLEEMKSELARIELELERKRDLLKSADEVQTMIDRRVEAARNANSLAKSELEANLESQKYENAVLRSYFDFIPASYKDNVSDLLKFLNKQKNLTKFEKVEVFAEIMQSLVLDEPMCKETKKLYDRFVNGDLIRGSHDREISKLNSHHNREER